MKTAPTLRHTFESMKKNGFLLIVFINSFALIGLFITQIYWVREAYGLIEEQFASSVRIAMKGVANQMLNYELKVIDRAANEPDTDSMHSYPRAQDVNLNLLTFKITEEFKCMRIGNDYEFAVIDLSEQRIIKGKVEKYTEELMNSPHQIILTGFEEPERYVLAAYFPGQQAMILNDLITWIIVSVAFALVLIIGFPVSLYIFNRQKRLSDMKSDFINNMTHEFKTPIATISLASEMLMNRNIQEDPAKTDRYARVIFDENTRLQNHVEQILSVSLLEKGQFKLKKKKINVHEIIDLVVDNFGMTIRNRGGEIQTHLTAEKYHISADESHLTNVLTNLIDNANKYSPDKPLITIGTQNTDKMLIITVEDMGVGISLENQQQIFKNMYRIPTGNIYNVKGFGIGLYYVKTIVEAHGGHINLKSELNKGSRFDVFLPLVLKSLNDEEHDQAKNTSG
jgi:two-component system phosphate regulon sensor histidine kinase PhoR